MGGELALLRTDQERAIGQLRELITGLSVQVTQLTNRMQEQGVHNGNTFSRLTRVDFPKFDGEDVQGWVYRCDQFFAIDNVVDNMKVKVASIHMIGRALLWHQSFMKTQVEGVWPNWEDYKTAVLARFGIGSFDDPLSVLMKLKQTGTVEAYQESFDALLNRVDLTEKQAISCFLSGLTDEVQNSVRMFKPQSLHDAYCLAKLQEATLVSMARKKPILDKPSPTFRNPPYSNPQNRQRHPSNTFNSYSRQPYSSNTSSNHPRAHSKTHPSSYIGTGSSASSSGQ